MLILENIADEWRDAKRTAWYSMKIKPIYDGYYEVQVSSGKDRLDVKVSAFNNGSWDNFLISKAVAWRGLAKKPKASSIPIPGHYDSPELRLLLSKNPEDAEWLNQVVQEFDTLSEESKKKVLDKLFKALEK